LEYSIDSFANWIVQYKWTKLSRHGFGMSEWPLGIMVQRFIDKYGVWSWAMVVELNQHHNSKNRIYDWDEFIFYSGSTIAIWINMN
jgi:hypothetical protein